MDLIFSVNNKIKLLKNEISVEQDNLLLLINEINDRLIEIRNQNRSENDNYNKEFEKINTKLSVKNIDDHLKMIFSICKNEEVLIKCLKYIIILFPNLSNLKSEIIDENPYKKYIFPLLLTDLIKTEFVSEVHKYMNNSIAFEEPKIQRGNVILYNKFIDQKISNIINTGTNFSNSKAFNSIVYRG